jgi:hypothetical protein
MTSVHLRFWVTARWLGAKLKILSLAAHISLAFAQQIFDGLTSQHRHHSHILASDAQHTYLYKHGVSKITSHTCITPILRLTMSFITGIFE